MVRDKGLEAFSGYFGSSLWKMVGLKAARPLYKLKKWSGIRDLKLLGPILAHLCGRWSCLRLRDLFRAYFGSSLWKMVGFKAARPLYKLKKWSGIRDLKLLGPILAHLCGRWSG